MRYYLLHMYTTSRLTFGGTLVSLCILMTACVVEAPRRMDQLLPLLLLPLQHIRSLLYLVMQRAIPIPTSFQ